MTPHDTAALARIVRDGLCIEVECTFDDGCGCLQLITEALNKAAALPTAGVGVRASIIEECAKVAPYIFDDTLTDEERDQRASPEGVEPVAQNWREDRDAPGTASKFGTVLPQNGPASQPEPYYPAVVENRDAGIVEFVLRDCFTIHQHGEHYDTIIDGETREIIGWAWPIGTNPNLAPRHPAPAPSGEPVADHIAGVGKMVVPMEVLKDLVRTIDNDINYVLDSEALIRAREAIASTEGAEPVADDWQIVPKSPTEAMWFAGKDADAAPGDSYTKVYCAMLAAAPDALTATGKEPG